MEGPTPVSALIHAATMVTAGIFIVIRTAFIFELSETVLGLAVCFGAITAFISALSACFLYDIKRIIAYSTCSQLGYMLFAAGLSQYGISLFHLVNHAFFKALLFLTAGAIIHSFSNEQDIRKLSFIYKRSPFLFTSLFIGNIAIMGLPFLAGFYSKDLILEAGALRLSQLFSEDVSRILFVLISLATCITAVYSCRIVYYTVFKQRQISFSTVSLSFFEQPVFIKIVLSILMVFSIFSGYFLSDFFSESNLHGLQVSLSFWANSLFFELEFLNAFQKLIPICINIFIVGLFLLFLFLVRKIMVQYSFLLVSLPIGKFVNLRVGSLLEYLSIGFYFYYNTPFIQFFIKMCINNFYYNEFYNFISSFVFYYGYTAVFLTFDKGVLEYIGPLGASTQYQKLSSIVIRWYKQPFRVHLFSLYLIIMVYFYLFEMFLILSIFKKGE
jgi:NADH:ubiquinone oxidoreductase subunit 5 (subunit L)/multisubunit Na+/H+ antiporter MnhA subunit